MPLHPCKCGQGGSAGRFREPTSPSVRHRAGPQHMGSPFLLEPRSFVGLLDELGAAPAFSAIGNRRLRHRASHQCSEMGGRTTTGLEFGSSELRRCFSPPPAHTRGLSGERSSHKRLCLSYAVAGYFPDSPRVCDSRGALPVPDTACQNSTWNSSAPSSCRTTTKKGGTKCNRPRDSDAIQS